VQLRWATANELRNNRFEVQRSTDGVSFGMVAGLPGHGTTTQPNYYQAFDAQAPSRLLYYRLGQFDTDGRATFSPVVAVAADATAMASFPNPTHEFIVLAAPATAYRLRNQLGQLLRHGLLPAGTGTIGLQGLPKGVYQLELRTATGWLRHRIMKE